MRKNHSKIVCIKLVHLPYLRSNVHSTVKNLVYVQTCNVITTRITFRASAHNRQQLAPINIPITFLWSGSVLSQLLQ